MFGGVFPLSPAAVGLTAASLWVKGFKGLKRVPIANRILFFFIISLRTVEAGKNNFPRELHWYLNKLCGKYGVWSFYRNLLIMLQCSCTIWHCISSLREQSGWSCYHWSPCIKRKAHIPINQCISWLNYTAQWFFSVEVSSVNIACFGEISLTDCLLVHLQC